MTRLFDDLPVAKKILLSLAVMSASASGAGWYAIANLSATDARYSALLERDGKAASWMTRANVAMLDAARLTNRLAAETDPVLMRAHQRDLGEAQRLADERLGNAARAMPAAAGDIEAVRAALRAAVQAGAPVERAALAGDKAQALQALAEGFDTKAKEARRTLVAVRDRLEAAAARASVDAAANTDSAWWNTLLAFGSGTAASVALALWMMRSGVSRPIDRIAARMKTLAEGEKQSPVPGAGRRDEVGRMAEAVEILRLAAVEQERVAAAAAAEQAARAARAGRVESLARGFEAETAEALRAVAAASAELDATAAEMQGAARGGAERATSLAAASEQASANVETVASSAEEMAASIAEVARQVAESARAARQAAEDARATDAAVGGLSEAAARIGEVVRLISGIAGQTNLLALNATIEAARAGEHGKGFAVVASEVKTLAQQTAKATEEIGAQIAAMQAETGRAVEAIRGIGSTVEALDGLTAQVAAAAEEQAAATKEIGRAVAEAAAGTRDVSRHAGGVTEGAQQTGAASAQVRAASGELARKAEGLRGKVGAFLAAVRAA